MNVTFFLIIFLDYELEKLINLEKKKLMSGIKVFLLILTILAVSCSSNASRDSEKMEFAEPCCDSDIDRAVLLKPFFNEQPDGSVIFGISAYRQALVEGEYCPSSETFRVEIINQKGKTIWSSNNNKMHMQVISDVLPENSGETYDYQLTWNGKDNSA